MKYHYLNKTQPSSKGESQLILFFNGWGMDEKPFLKMASPNVDVLIVSDYSSYDNIEELYSYLNNFDEIKLIAWSMGVWAAYHILSQSAIPLSFALAVNGTLQPIHLLYGIDPLIVSEMCATFSEEVRDGFYRRMCRKELPRFSERLPTRSLESQRDELSVLFELAQREAITELSCTFYDKALISTKDFVIPTAHQKQFWKSLETVLVSTSHFPFWLWPDFAECLRFCEAGEGGIRAA